MLGSRVTLTVTTPAGPVRLGTVGASAVPDWCRRLACIGQIVMTRTKTTTTARNPK